jgi:demethylmacrocin O-methyltransferase
MRKTLDEIALSTGAGGDKDSLHHAYTYHYEEIFEPLRDKPIRLLEIGVGDGSSMKIWLEYFSVAGIYGVDIAGPKPIFDNLRQVFIQGDQTKHEFWKKLNSDLPGGWDVIIDDGSHKPDGIIRSFNELWPHLRHGGYYIIEDLNCAYMVGYQSDNWPNHMEFLGSLLHGINAQTKYRSGFPPFEPLYFPAGINGNRGIKWLRFSEELCIIKKK